MQHLRCGKLSAHSVESRRRRHPWRRAKGVAVPRRPPGLPRQGSPARWGVPCLVLGGDPAARTRAPAESHQSRWRAEVDAAVRPAVMAMLGVSRGEDFRRFEKMAGIALTKSRPTRRWSWWTGPRPALSTFCTRRSAMLKQGPRQQPKPAATSIAGAERPTRLAGGETYRRAERLEATSERWTRLHRRCPPARTPSATVRAGHTQGPFHPDTVPAPAAGGGPTGVSTS